MRLPGRIVAAAGPVFLLAGALCAQEKPAPAVGGQYQAKSHPPEVKTITRVTSPAKSTESAPQPMGYESNLYCFGYIGPADEQFPFTTIGAENLVEQSVFITGDLMYLNGGLDRGLKEGEEFWLVTQEQDIVHPTTNKSLGRYYHFRGRASVLSVQDRTATVSITAACGDISLGVALKPFEPIPIPLAHKMPAAAAGDPPSGKATGHIVHSKDGLVAIGSDSAVMVDLGAVHGIQPGDFLTIFRYAQEREYGIRPFGVAWELKAPPVGMEIPRTYLGEVAVLMVGDRWAICRVTDSYRLIEIGDQVELK
ncbi:MAG: hypothetical protein ACREB3_08625 [Burkholderiales bacterium]